MAERKYSIGEIDRMRKAIEWCYPTGVPYLAAERAADVENRLRTYMQNGTDPIIVELRISPTGGYSEGIRGQDRSQSSRSRMQPFEGTWYHET